MKALSNNHSFMLAINEEREADAKSSIPDGCQGKEVGRERNGNFWRKEICEEEGSLRIITPYINRDLPNASWTVRNQRGLELWLS